MRICFHLLLVWLLCFGITGALQAQEQRTPVKVYLKNGNVLQGVIITSVFDEYLTLELDEVTHLDIRFDKIKSIYFGKYAKEEPEEKEFESKPGFYHSADLGLLLGRSYAGSNASLSLNVVNGYQFNQTLGTGLGLGLDLYGDIVTLPVYASIKGLLRKKKVTPYYFLNTGYAFAWANEENPQINYTKTRGGWMLHPGLGYQFHMTSSALLIGLGYRLQKTTLDYTQPGWNGDIFYHEKRILRRLSLSIGFNF